MAVTPEEPSAAPSLSLRNPWKDVHGRPLPFGKDEDVLRFLHEAEVVGNEPVGEGINQTRKLTLELDGRRMHAAFRTVRLDQYLPDPLAPSSSRNHRDDYRFEAAAYRLSRSQGLRLVPPTVIRRIAGKEGSLQAWVEDATTEKTRRLEGRPPPDE